MQWRHEEDPFSHAKTFFSEFEIANLHDDGEVFNQENSTQDRNQ